MRAFVSIPIPVDRLSDPPPSLENHLTLRFLGEIERSRVPELQEAIARASARSAPFRLELRGMGVFPDPSRPRVLWIGIGEGRAEIQALNAAVSEELVRVGEPREGRPFVPHVTIRRIRSAAEAESALGELSVTARRSYGSFLVERVDLQESTLHRTGAVHQVLASAPLIATRPTFP